jgi:hypothetical protein
LAVWELLHSSRRHASSFGAAVAAADGLGLLMLNLSLSLDRHRATKYIGIEQGQLE